MSTVKDKVCAVTGAGSGIGRALAIGAGVEDRILGVNLWGVIHGTTEFLPHLIASGDGHLVNVSSLNGYLAQPRMVAYCSSKFAVRGFTEAVRADMLRERHPVHVTVVHPGGIKTNIANAALAEATDATDEDRRRAPSSWWRGWIAGCSADRRPLRSAAAERRP